MKICVIIIAKASVEIICYKAIYFFYNTTAFNIAFKRFKIYIYSFYFLAY
ncbi:hypothetical protein O166_14425 [Pseudogulbenkiania ferrooxidans EGD-HP2]|uniref:Uncharacterized protein n=1 Tax=Pseudogulbenkiania ferrooxidans EGD-HP2 TaxID=1388764 RepID=A0ABN0N2W9_9NEIS|nr:hypothetical protein O166_14425 [Pseudogulbenkiania ferrooxidans EGD-HP2]